MRLFTAIRLSKEAEEVVQLVQQRLQGQVVFQRWQSLQNIHLTLNFLGEIEAEKIQHLKETIKESVVDFTPFSLELSQLGVFPNEQRPRVLWLGVGGEVQLLQKLQRNIAQSLLPFGYNEGNKEYKPHITLAREPRGKINVSQLNESLAGLVSTNWIVDRIYLYQSELQVSGAVHSIVDEYCL